MNSFSIEPRRSFLIVFHSGDDVLGELRRFAEENGVRGGYFIAIGSFRTSTLAYWNAQTKEYEHIEVDEQAEVLSFAGDAGVDAGQPRIHAHATLGRRDGSTIAGHVIRATVHPTLEMHLVDFGATIVRGKDEATGLSLIQGLS